MNIQYKQVFLVLIVAMSMVSGAIAQIKLPAIVSSNMVLQRNTEVNLWGWSGPGEKLTINVSWENKEYSARADQEGKWKLTVATNDKRGPQKITILSGSETVVLENILLGEVWICSGQSNMEQPVKGFRGQPTFGSTEALLNSRSQDIRLFKITNYGTKEPLDNPMHYSPWVAAGPESVADFGAVAYFFGKGLYDFLDVPIGLIQSSRGASSVQAWMSKDVISKYEEVDLSAMEEIDQTKNHHIPTVLFNAMIHPIIPYTIKGAIWYQGEANRSEPEYYKKIFPAMVQDWRNRWGQGDFPFYFVQIAPFSYGGNTHFQDVGNSAFQREAQSQCTDLIPNSGIAITTDIGDENFIHPPRKKEVGERLLLLALNKTYGINGIESESPVYKSMEIQDNQIILKFDHAESGLYLTHDSDNFEIAGEDHVFHPAVATVVNRTELSVESPMVQNPVAVRYAWNNWAKGTLFNGRLLPASSFRTDNWEKAARAEQ